MWFGIWRFAVAPSNAAEKNRNIGAQLQSLTCIMAPKLIWKIYFLYDFWCAQSCSFRAVFGLPVPSLIPTPEYFTSPAEGVPLELGTGAKNVENYNDGATRWSKKF